MVRRSEDRQSRFEKIRARLAKESLDSGGFYKPKVGKNTVRVLPEVGEMEFFFVNVGQHFLSRTNRHFCPNFTLGLPCPICEFVSELYAAGDDASTALARKLGVRKQFWMNLIDRANESAGPQIYTPGKMAFSQIATLAMDPEYGDLIIGDAETEDLEGLDIVIDRTGSGLQTRYNVIAKRETTPLNPDPAVIDQWLAAAMDLSPVELTEDPAEDYAITHDENGNSVAVVSVEPYERIKEAFEGVDYDAVDGADDEEEEQEPEDRVSSVIASRRGRRGRRR